MTTKRRQHTLVQRHTAASVHKSAIRRTKWRLEEAGYQPKCCVMSVFGTGSLLIVAKKYYWPHSSIKSGSRNKQSVCILYHIHIYITIDKCLLSTKSGSLNARVQYSNMQVVQPLGGKPYSANLPLQHLFKIILNASPPTMIVV